MSIRGHFVWEELITTDPSSAAMFYSKIAGIKTEPAPGDPSYTLLVTGAGRMGGLMTLGANPKIVSASPIWLSYIGTLNVEETVRQAESLGGRIIRPSTAMGDGGRFAILQDPQGAVFAVYTSPRPYQPPTAVPLRGMSWHELVTSDMSAAFPFYQQLFGWHVVNEMDMGPGMGTYRLFGPEGSKDAFGGMYTKPAQQPGPPAWLPYIKVANVQAATTTAKRLSAQIMHGPADVPGGMITIGIDPQGVMFALHAAVAAPVPKKKSAPQKKSKPKSRPKARPKSKAKARPKKKVAKTRKAGSKK